jgi:5-methylcytosine-specific restriction endonuclease McrBC regulatory subunit McrC
MPAIPKHILRICEWARIENHDLSAAQRDQLSYASQAWAQQQQLPAAPLTFSGSQGQFLCAAQYVGVVEVDDVAVEIYPKLDSELLAEDEAGVLSSQTDVSSVMRNLLWILEVAEHRKIIEVDTGHLEEIPETFLDFFAYLLGKNLLCQLTLGVSHAYVAHSDDLRTVRGKIRLHDQVTRNLDRYDRIACDWDEFTVNTSLNRLFKCACKFLVARVRHESASNLLTSCLALLDEVEEVGPLTALRQVQNLRFDRSTDRFQLPFDLAKRLLLSTGYALGVGGSNTFVFLVDMNELFENYVRAALEAKFRTAILPQEPVGYLLQTQKGRIRQIADYVWSAEDIWWIGDAKYKHLSRGQDSALRFYDLPDADEPATLAGHVLNSNDVRQLTVYAELAKKKYCDDRPVKLMLLYPYVGPDSAFFADCTTTWNGDDFWIVPIRVKRQASVTEIMPKLISVEPKLISVYVS